MLNILKYNISLAVLADRVRNVVKPAFDEKRIIVFSGSPAKETEDVLGKIRQIKKGGCLV